jgi:hypothetical protein
MAESAKKELPPKAVQELVINGDQLPERYIHKGGDVGVLDVPLVQIPVVDIALLSSFSTSTEELQKLRSALSSWGCFQVLSRSSNHTSKSTYWILIFLGIFTEYIYEHALTIV